MGHHRKLVEVGQQIENNVSLLDRAKRQLLDDERMATGLVIAQQLDESRVGGAQVLNPYRSVE